jgi:triosephosphate isomerase (TIM)
MSTRIYAEIIMKKLIIANWKMNPATEKEAVRLARSEDFKNVVIAPPFPYLSAVKRVLKKSALGAQDVFWEKDGAYTGGVSAGQLKKMGVKYVIIGHSERRSLGETDEIINKKVKTALKEGLKVILCVGEPKRGAGNRKQELKKAKSYIRRQLQKDIKGISKNKDQMSNIIVAYEPIWAIGTGRADKPNKTVEMVEFIKRLMVISYKLRIKVLYGGSVKARNAARFLGQMEIDGALVGGASLKPAEFRKIVAVE